MIILSFNKKSLRHQISIIDSDDYTWLSFEVPENKIKIFFQIRTIEYSDPKPS